MCWINEKDKMKSCLMQARTLAFSTTQAEPTPSGGKNMTDSNGKNPYRAGKQANTGQYPLNANSGATSLMMAYPHVHPATFLPVLGFKLKNLSNYRFR